MTRRAAAILVLGLAGLSSACAPRAAESSPAAVDGSGAAPARRGYVLAPTPGGTTVSAALAIPGSAVDDPARGGLRLLASRALLEEARPRLEDEGAIAGVSCDRALFTFWVVAPRERWEQATRTLLETLFQGEISASALERARDGLRESLALDQANPAWQARLGARRALHGEDSPWSRPGCGVPELLPSFDPDEVSRMAGQLGRGATAALTGPFEPAEADRLFAPLLDPAAMAAAPGAGGHIVPAAPPPRDPGRVYMERNTVTAWLSLAWRFEETDPEAIRLLGALLRDAVAPGVQRPEVFHAAYEVERYPGGGALILHVILAPGAAVPMAEAAEALVRKAARGDVHPAVLERIRRRHVGERLRELAAPESRAVRLARQAALGLEAAEWPPVRALDSASVRSAAAALGPPARAVVGPREARPAVVP